MLVGCVWGGYPDEAFWVGIAFHGYLAQGMVVCGVGCGLAVAVDDVEVSIEVWVEELEVDVVEGVGGYLWGGEPEDVEWLLVDA